jgi:hypothetical protein
MKALIPWTIILGAIALTPVARCDENDDAEAAADATPATQAAAQQPPGSGTNEVHIHHHHYHYGGNQPAYYFNQPTGPANPAQQSYPQYPGYSMPYPAAGGWGGWGWGGGATIAGSYLQGMGAYAQGAGQYNLMTAEAARQAEAARAEYMQNQMSAMNDYFLAREANRRYRAELHGPPPTPEELYEANLARLPKRPRLDQFNPVTGKINWPDVLKQKELDKERSELDGLFAKRTHQDSGVGSENYHDVQMAINSMHAKLHDEIKSLSPAEYMAALQFLDSLSFEARFPPSTAPAEATAGASTAAKASTSE